MLVSIQPWKILAHLLRRMDPPGMHKTMGHLITVFRSSVICPRVTPIAGRFQCRELSATTLSLHSHINRRYGLHAVLVNDIENYFDCLIAMKYRWNAE